MALAQRVGVSTRHLSFVETGRSRPSPELIEAIGIHLDIPLRERNAMLLAAGYAPRYRHTPLDDPAMAGPRSSLQRLLDAHMPYPGFVLDRHWNVVLANGGAAPIAALLPDELTTPTLNVFRSSLHPKGLAPLTANLPEWTSYLLRQLERLIVITHDDELIAIRDEVTAYPAIAEILAEHDWRTPPPVDDPLIPCDLSIGGMTLSLFTTLTSFGTPQDVTLDELSIELFFPTDDATAEFFRTAGA